MYVDDEMLLKNQNSSRSLQTDEKRKSKVKFIRHIKIKQTFSVYNHWDFKVVVLIIQIIIQNVKN